MNNQKQEHSPLPWEASTNGLLIFHHPDPSGNRRICTLNSDERMFSESERRANAALIVEACNNYERVKAERAKLKTMFESAQHDFEHERLERRSLDTALEQMAARFNRALAERDELLAACKELLRTHVPWCGDTANAEAIARNAIAQAEGSKQ